MKNKRIAILQSNYIPWKGYFDIIKSVDEFVILDEVQFTKNDWRNRNMIKTQNGTLWLTIPVRQRALSQKISEIEIVSSLWAVKHFKSIRQYYSKSKYFREYEDWLSNMYQIVSKMTCLSDINRFFITEICNLLDIKTKITCSSQFELSQDKNTRIIDICKQTGATEYLCGPTAKCYLNEYLYVQNDIELTWIDYSGYEEYEQLYPPFNHQVSIIDLLLNTGHNCHQYMKKL